MKTNLTISLILLTMCVFFHEVSAQSKDSTVEKGYYGLLNVSGGYIHKWMPGSTQAPYDFMLGASYVNGYRFNCGSKRANVGLAYTFDGELNRTTDAYRMRYFPQVRIKFGVEF